MKEYKKLLGGDLKGIRKVPKKTHARIQGSVSIMKQSIPTDVQYTYEGDVTYGAPPNGPRAALTTLHPPSPRLVGLNEAVRWLLALARQKQNILSFASVCQNRFLWHIGGGGGVIAER